MGRGHFQETSADVLIDVGGNIYPSTVPGIMSIINVSLDSAPNSLHDR